MLHKRSIKEKLLKGGAWAFAGKFVTALTGLAVSALLARLLTPGEMGTYFLTFSLVSVAAVVAQLGMTQSIVRFVAESMGTEQYGRARQSVILVMRIALCSSLIVACFLAFGVGRWIASSVFKSAVMSQLMGLAAAWVVIVSFQQLISEVYRGFHDIKLATVFGGMVTSVFSTLLFLSLWLMQMQTDLEQIFILSIGAGLSSTLISSAFLWNKLAHLPANGRTIHISDILSVSWPLLMTNLSIFVLAQGDIWIIGFFRPQEEVAIYGAASKLVAIVTMPLLIVNAVVPPLIAEMYAQGKNKKLEKTLRAIATLGGVPALLGFLALVAFGSSALGLVFGEFYKTGEMILVVLCLGQLVAVWTGSCGQVLAMTGHQIVLLVIAITSGLVMLVSAYWMALLYGSVGVAFASSGAVITQNLLMLYFARRKVGIWTHSSPSALREINWLFK